MSVSSASTTTSPGISNALIRWIFSSIGKKTVVAVTGIVLVLFVIGHMIGNMTVFFGPDTINAYAMHLRDLGPLLWLIRLFMLTSVVLHIWFTMLVWKENVEAHPQKYAVFAPMKTTIFARTMRLTGLILLAFIVFHLAHFTLLLVDPGYANYHTDLHGREVHDVYRMVIVGFRNPFVSLFYIVAMALLAFHLSHGVASLFQTLGVTDQRMRFYYETGGQILAWILVRRICRDTGFDPCLWLGQRSCKMTLDAHMPPGPLERKWTTYKNNAKIISPANKRKFKLIIVGSGLAGGVSCGNAWRAGIQYRMFLLSG